MMQKFSREDFERIKRKLPPGLWDKLTSIPDNLNGDEYFRLLHDKYGITKAEARAISYYKSPSSEALQMSLRKRQFQKRLLSEHQHEPGDWEIRSVPHLDSLINKNKIPNELSGHPLYRGARIDYGTALIKSRKKPGDIIRDPRYSSFSLNPQTAMFHTSTTPFGDDVGMVYKKRKVLLEHIARGGETGLYGGPEDLELEVIYPRDKKWKITNVRDDKFRYQFGSEDDLDRDKDQNVRIYTIERKKKKVVKKKPLQRKKIIKRKPVKRCKCK
jgi:hypothetical protein